MENNTVINIQQCFPKAVSIKNGKEAIVDDILACATEEGRVEYAGFTKQDTLRNAVSGWIQESEVHSHQEVTPHEKKHIEDTITAGLHESLQFLDLASVDVFVFPRMHQYGQAAKIMGYVTGYTPRVGVIHVYLATEHFSITSLKSTVVHEFNHAVFFNNHSNKAQTILDALVMEGLAENFEEVVMGYRPPVSEGLTETYATQSLKHMMPAVDTAVSWDVDSLYRDVFLGGNNYKRWTGYSIGYYVVKSFQGVNPGLSWEEIMSIDTEEIFHNSPFVNQIKRS